MRNSLNFYFEKYEILTNPLLVTAGFLNPTYRSFKQSTPEEYDNFLKISKVFLAQLLKKLNIKNEIEIENSARTPASAASNSSFFNENTNPRNDKNELSYLENEIILYLKDDYKDEVSKYWITRKSVYPNLFTLARIILECPATTVATERLFSNCSDQMWAKRNRMSNETFEKLMLVYSSLKI